MIDESAVDVSMTDVVSTAPVRTYTDEQVNEIVKRKKTDAYEAGKKAATQSFGGMEQPAPMSRQEIESFIDRKADEKAEQMATRAFANQIWNDWSGKVTSIAQKNSGFTQAYIDLDLDNDPAMVSYLNALKSDDLEGVILELAENPGKYAQISTLAASKPKLAQSAILKLADSIKVNSDGRNVRSSSEPLSQISPSSKTVNTDNGYGSVKSFKNASWLRG